MRTRLSVIAALVLGLSVWNVSVAQDDIVSGDPGISCATNGPDGGVQGCFCNCYYDSNCSPAEQCSHSVPCIRRNDVDKPLFCPNQDYDSTPPCEPTDPEYPCAAGFPPRCCDESKLANGPCDGFCLPVVNGSDCGNENPRSLAAVHTAWTTAYDRAGARGGGPIGPFTAQPSVLAHTRIKSVACRLELQRSALNLQETCRSGAVLEHPEFELHREEDHFMVDLSDDKCTLSLGRICAMALESYIVGRPDEGDRILRSITEACPDGQALGARCEGHRDEIACLQQELRAKASFLTTARRAEFGAGDVSGDGEECQQSSDCGPTSFCIDGVCFTVLCL